MKCPFCHQEMICGGTICHYNPNCPIHDNPVPTEVLELLDCTRKALKIAVDALKYLKYEQPNNQPRLPDLYVIDKALAETTALEQKD